MFVKTSHNVSAFRHTYNIEMLKNKLREVLIATVEDTLNIEPIHINPTCSIAVEL